MQNYNSTPPQAYIALINQVDNITCNVACGRTQQKLEFSYNLSSGQFM